MNVRTPGMRAIDASAQLIAEERARDASAPLEGAQISGRLRLLVDQIMSEGGLWDRGIAADAIRQAEGDVVEAAHLVRSFRLSLRRLAVSAVTDADELQPMRRVVPIYRTPPGKQVLGRTRDFLPRLLGAEGISAQGDQPPAMSDDVTVSAKRIHELLQERDLLVPRSAPEDPDPVDVARASRDLDTDRSATLSLLARGETAALVVHWYTRLLTERRGNPGVGGTGELRTGYLPVRVTNPLTGGEIEIGEVQVTEAETVENLDAAGEDVTRFDVGYGLCFGQNERKALAISALDIDFRRDEGRTGFAHTVLSTADGMDANGLLEHVKLPHYVSFRAAVDQKARLRPRGPRSSTGQDS